MTEAGLARPPSCRPPAIRSPGQAGTNTAVFFSGLTIHSTWSIPAVEALTVYMVLSGSISTAEVCCSWSSTARRSRPRRRTPYRRKISRQLSKGESLHALKQDLLYAHEGMVRALVRNAVVTRTTEYYGLAVEQMRAARRRVDDEVLAHISPAHSENINFFGATEVDIEGELAQLGPTGYRPLRVRDTLF